MIVIDYDKCCWKDGACSKCGCSSDSNCCDGCAEVCPVDAITRADKLVIDEEACIDCNACIEACENEALTQVEA